MDKGDDMNAGESKGCENVSGLSESRLVVNFNYDWSFVKADLEGAHLAGFDDGEWSVVSAPHTYNDIDTFAHFQSKNHTGEREQWSGRTWYRKSFELPAEARGKKVFIEFEGVRQLAEVYLNGVLLGKSENGFLPFGFDLTPHLKVEGRNVLAVMCDNSFVMDAEGEIKWSTYEGGSKFSWNNPHWHPPHGGIYRNVRLHVTDLVHVTLPLYNNMETVGTYVYTPEVREGFASIGVEIEVRNERADTLCVEMCSEVLDAGGKEVCRIVGDGELKGGETSILCGLGALENPMLWDPERPYLYTVRTRLLVEGAVVDTVETPLGIRFWEFRVEDGFIMNGRRMKLQGWGQKSTNEWAGLGTAFPDWMQYLTLEMLRDAGGNHVRWGHTAGGPAQVRAADQLGLVTVQPGVDGEGDLEGHSWDVRADAFRDAIVYFRNNPSILVWEGGNQAVTLEHVQQLRGIADCFDPNGRRAYAHRRPSQVTIGYSDLEIGTQGGHKFRSVPVIEGEYNREECPRRVWDNFSPPTFGYKVPRRQEYELTSESFAANQVTEYVTRLGGRGHGGGASWIFSDSTSGGRNDSEVTRSSGVVDAVRLPKEAWYACRSIFDPKPQVHLIGHWTYPENVETVKPLFVVSNCAQVELKVNGRSMGFGAVSHRHLFTFDAIKWEPGYVEVVALDEGGQELVSQKKETTGDAVQLRLTAITGPDGLCADGSDIALFDVEAVDSEGRRHPTVEQRVDFEITGPGVWRGGYNSGKEHSTNNLYLDLECGVARVAVRSTRDTGEIRLVASSSGLASGECVVESHGIVSSNWRDQKLPQWPTAEELGDLNLVWEEEAIGSDNEQSEGTYINGFSYSGTRLTLPVCCNAEDGLMPYVDRSDSIEDIPEFLRGSDYIQTSDDESLYEAVDLMDFSVCAEGMLYIARDEQLPLPGWMKEFEAVSDGLDGLKRRVSSIPLGDSIMKLYGLRLEKDSSITLGSNRETGPEVCRMYFLFFVPDSVSEA